MSNLESAPAEVTRPGLFDAPDAFGTGRACWELGALLAVQLLT